MVTAKQTQQKLLSLGFPLPQYGADGKPGGETWDAIMDALAELEARRDGVTPPEAVKKTGKIDRTLFLATIQKLGLFAGWANPSQADGMGLIIDKWETTEYTDLRWLAYMLATAYHETARTMQPVIETRQPGEMLNPTVVTAISRLDHSWAKGSLPWVSTPYWRKDKDGKSWLGRGLVQLTHKANYEKMALLVGVDLVDNPARAMDADVAVDIMFEGMLKGVSGKGDFTGVGLEKYFSDTNEDWVNARRIINGKDKAEAVAGYGKTFLKGLELAAA